MNEDDNGKFRLEELTHNFKLRFHPIITLNSNVRGFFKLKKFQKFAKNSEVDGWVKPQLGFFFFLILCFSCFLCCFHVLECFQKK